MSKLLFPKPTRIKTKRKRSRLESIPKLVTKADTVFSKWVRTRDEYKCVLCGKTLNTQCGHMIKRAKKLTRYDEFNCNTLCRGCNKLDNYEPQHYIGWFLTKYGQDKYLQLKERSKIVHKWTREELHNIISKYENSKGSE